MVHAPRARLPAVHPVGWDFEVLALFEHKLDGKIGVGSGMHDQVIGWDDEVPIDEYQVMADANADSPRNTQASTGTAGGSQVLVHLVA